MFERLLLAIDSSESSRKAADETNGLVQLTKSQVQVLHVREAVSGTRSGPIWPEGSSEASSFVDAAVATLKSAGVEVSGSVRDSISGAIAQEILDAANEWQASMIVMGTRGHAEHGSYRPAWTWDDPNCLGVLEVLRREVRSGGIKMETPYSSINNGGKRK
jgi:nucleotide-binding universal stress UspA family protein